MHTQDAARYPREGLSTWQANPAVPRGSNTVAQAIVASLAVVAMGCLIYLGTRQVESTEVRFDPIAQLPAIDVEPTVVALPDGIPTAPAPDAPPVQDMRVVERALSPVPLSMLVARVDAAIAPFEPTSPSPPADITAVQQQEPEKAAPAPDCFARLQEQAAQSVVYFDLGSADMSAEDQARIAELGRLAESCNGAIVQVAGHSDTTGNDLINLDLSWRRADTAVAAMSRHGIDTSGIEPVGFGARAPIAQGDATDEDQNRRVEFIILKSLDGN